MSERISAKDFAKQIYGILRLGGGAQLPNSTIAVLAERLQTFAELENAELTKERDALREYGSEFADHLASEIWDCWHGALAKIPPTHKEAVVELLDMFGRIRAALTPPAPKEANRCRHGVWAGDHCYACGPLEQQEATPQPQQDVPAKEKLCSIVEADFESKELSEEERNSRVADFVKYVDEHNHDV